MSQFFVYIMYVCICLCSHTCQIFFVKKIIKEGACEAMTMQAKS